MKFIHTADWHLGARLSAIGPRSSESVQWRFDAVRRVFDLAVEEGAGFVLAAGDIFDSADPERKVRAKVIELLRDTPVPLYLIPGNHDPLLPGSVWTNQEFQEGIRGLANVRVLLSPDPVEQEAGGTKVIILPAPVTFKHEEADTSATLERGTRGGDSVRIGIAHGGLQGYFGQEIPHDWVREDRADVSGLDYLALGDFHGYTLDDHPAAARRTRYSGAPEPLAVDQENAGYALVVEIDGPGAEPSVRPVRVGTSSIISIEQRVSPEEGWKFVKEKVDEIENPGQTLLRLNLSGVLSVSQYAEYRQWLNELYQQLLGIIENTSGLYREPSDEEWEVLGLDPIEKRLVDILKDPEKTERFASEEGGIAAAYASRPSVRREVLALLYEQLAR